MKILNFGSMNIDNVYSVDHFVAPGETLSSNSYGIFAGGKGLNQAIALSKAGAQVYFAGKIGKDGDFLTNTLKKNGVNTDFINTDGSVTGHAIIQVTTAGENCILLYGGANHEIDREYADSVFENFDSDDILLIQNEISLTDYIIDKARQKGMKTAFNPSPVTNDIRNYPLDKIDWFILNEIEGKLIFGGSNEAEIIKSWKNKYPDSAIVLTLGKRGAIYADKMTYASHGIYDVKVADTTAAGDTFTGYFLAGISEALDISEVLRRASVASSLAVSKKGAADSIPLLKEVLEADIELIQ